MKAVENSTKTKNSQQPNGKTLLKSPTTRAIISISN